MGEELRDLGEWRWGVVVSDFFLTKNPNLKNKNSEGGGVREGGDWRISFINLQIAKESKSDFFCGGGGGGGEERGGRGEG